MHNRCGPRVDAAIDAAEKEVIDIAFLDVSVAGRDSFDVAQVLERRGIPYLFTTAFNSHGLPARYRQRPVLYKPYSCEALLEAVSATLFAVDHHVS